ncbi:xylitol dehydrogenase [Hysterangium stoloniferum]|nr:xylitol dehydrogenase [Hysterangium stoloniferum]
MSENTSFVLHGILDAKFEPRPIPEINDDEVLVSIKKTGICGSDVHYLVHGRIADFVVNKPMVLGHESSGVIAKVGSKVKTLQVGQRVALEPGQTCRTCDACKAGSYELCPDIIFAATPPYDGTLGRFYRIPADLAYPLPDNLTLEDGAMMEPLSVAVHALANLGKVRANQTVAVFGAGPVGLLTLAVAKAFGAKRIISVDIIQARLDFAKKYAATDIYMPSKKNHDESNMAYSRRNAVEMKQKLGLADRGANGVDIVLDASGAEVSIQTSIFLAKEGGTFIQVGMGNAEVTIPITHALGKQLTIKGSFRYGPGDYPTAISLVAQGKIDLKPLVTHRFPFDDAVAAFDVTRFGKSPDGKGAIKVIISGPDVSINDY